MPFRRYPLNIWSLACLALTLYGSTVGAQDGEAIAIEAGKTVSIDYTLSLVGAEVLESNLEGQPLIYTQGNGEILNALETELLGLVAGDEKLVTLAPEDAYGTIDPTAFQEVPIEQVPEEARKAMNGNKRQNALHYPRHVVAGTAANAVYELPPGPERANG